MTIFYNFSGGMESAAMLVLEADRIKSLGAIVRFADTGKHFPEMYSSMGQIDALLGLSITTVPRRVSFDDFLFKLGGMIRKGTNDCSRRMKRSNLSRHMNGFPRPYEVNLGFNAGEVERAEAFSERNERAWLHWRYPLIEHHVTREDTREICMRAGFSILVEMYRKMGRLDCFWCGNQTTMQARRVIEHYPDLAREWMDAEARKGHSFRPTPLRVLAAQGSLELREPESGCSCFGGEDDFAEDSEQAATRSGAAEGHLEAVGDAAPAAPKEPQP